MNQLIDQQRGGDDDDDFQRQLLLQHLNGAARTVLSAGSHPSERSNASRYLEEWMMNPHAWIHFNSWLRQLSRTNDNDGQQAQGQPSSSVDPEEDRSAILLLCLQLLQTKSRKSLPYVESGSTMMTDPSVHNSVNGIANTLSELIRRAGNDATTGASSSCAALTCLSVRVGWMSELVRRSVVESQAMINAASLSTMSTAPNERIPIWSALKMLECIPSELEACALSSSRISSILAPFVPQVLEATRSVLMMVLVLDVMTVPALPTPNSAVPMRGSFPVAAATAVASLKALAGWIRTGHVPLSALNASSSSSSEPTLLSVLAQIVSILPPPVVDGDNNSKAWESVVEGASDALEEAIRVPTDACTSERQQALQMMLQFPGFIVIPLQYASSKPSSNTQDRTSSAMAGDSWEEDANTGEHDDDGGGGCRWENGSRALASLLCTLVCEHVDDWVTTDGALQSQSTSFGGQDGLPSLLLWLQHHPMIAVRMTVLDVWLAVQDVPTSERAEAWRKPIFSRLLPVVLSSCRCPKDYDSDGGGWDDSVVDESEWNEYRRLTSDVLASTYLLLRGDYVEFCVRDILATSLNGANDWRASEVALYGLVAVARDVCARIKSGAGAGGREPDSASSIPGQKSLVTIDRERTSESLHRVQWLCGNNPDDAVSSLNRIHARVLEAACEFFGAYSPAWKTMYDSPHASLQLLAFLCRALSVLHDATMAAKSIRSTLVACAPVLSTTEGTQLLPLFHHLMESSVNIPGDDVLGSVVEGCTRLLVQVKNDGIVSQGLAAVVDPLIRSGGSALQHLQATASNDVSMVAVEQLSRCLLGVRVLIQFCDSLPSGGDNSNPYLAGLLNAVWQFMEQATQYATSIPSPISVLLDRLLSVHEQLLTTVPSQMAPHVEATILQALGILERSRDAAALRYLARGVEVYGTSTVPSFRNVLERASTVVSVAVASGQNSAELVASYFDLCHRYLLYCPAVLIENPQFPSIAGFAAESISSNDGDRECIRAAFHLLGQLFGHRTLVAIPAPSRQLLDAAASRIDEVLHALGGKVVSSGVHTLAGGGSQMLWPPAVDCLYAVLSSGLAALPTPDGSTVGRQWLEASKPSTVDDVLFRQVSSLLFEVLADGPPSKGRAKVRMLLTDFGRIQAGEASSDCLITYSYS